MPCGRASNKSGSSSFACRIVILPSSAAICLGRFSSANFSLKLSRFLPFGGCGALGGFRRRLFRLALAVACSAISAPALRQHVAIAAGIFVPRAVAFRHDHRIDHAIEEIAVMADQDHRAGIIAERLFQHVERFKIEVVGRLVEHQQIRRFRQRTRQHHAAALAAGERAQRRADLLGREQEILHVADDMLGLRRRWSRCRPCRRSAPLSASSPDRGCRGSGRAPPFADWRRASHDLRRARACR